MKKYWFAFFWLLLAVSEFVFENPIAGWVAGLTFVTLAVYEAVCVKRIRNGKENKDTKGVSSSG